MGLSAVTYALCKKYTDKSLDGIGALKGAPCTVQSVVKTDGRSVVTLEWQSNSGVIQTSKVYVNDGVSIWISGRDYAVNDVVIKNNQLFICNTANTDTTFDPSKWSVVISGGNDDFNIIDVASDLPASFGPTDRKVYYCIANNTYYLWDGTKWSVINTGVTIRELTKAQYDALTPAERNNGTIYFVIDEAGGGNDDYYIVSTVADLPTDLGPTDLKIYYCVDTGGFYLWNGTAWSVISAGGVTIRELTKAQYDALSPADKNNGTIYFVTDEESWGGKATQVSVLPTPSNAELGNIYQYIGNTTSAFQNGCFYKCIFDNTSMTYAWQAIVVTAFDAFEDEPIDFDNY